MRIWKWLYPGIGVKRWIFILLVSLSLISAGVALLTGFYLVSFLEKGILKIITPLTGRLSSIVNTVSAIILIIIGLLGINWALQGVFNGLNEKLSHNEVVDHLYQKKVLQKGPKIVALGGGTGLSNLLRGIKKYTSNITAIVTVADDGGSSGKLRDELGMLPPGDIRNCLVALADTEPLMEQLFQYRFSSEGHLVGHSFGNLFIASLAEVLGDFEEAVKESSKVLAIRGQVLPATNEDVRLGAVYTDRSRKMGESVIPEAGKRIERVFLKPSSCKPTADALAAIKEADIILIGPGSLYTSIIPNLLVEGIARAIKESPAIKIYVCNVMTQPGETTGYTVSDHIQAIFDHSMAGLFDYVIVNREESAANLAKRYEEEGAFPVKIDREKILKQGVKIVEGDLLTSEGYIRHDPVELAKTIFKIAESR
ncbi:MAG: hypothetical protein PWR10_2001 [Halanaerobiales bacterium]|nr:hypothetical protein [Halanaerobiales bacterium]